MADSPEEVLLTTQAKPRRRLKEPTPWPNERLRRFHTRVTAKGISAAMAGYYHYGLGPNGKRHTVRSISWLFELPATSCWRMIASVDPADALAAAQRFGLIKREVDLSDVAAERGSDPQLRAALGTERGE